MSRSASGWVWSLKLQHTFDSEQVTRQITYRLNENWDDLVVKVARLFFIPLEDVALSYVDDENDQIIMSSNSELDTYVVSLPMGINIRHKLNVVDLAKLRQSVLARPRSIFSAGHSTIDGAAIPGSTSPKTTHFPQQETSMTPKLSPEHGFEIANESDPQGSRVPVSPRSCNHTASEPESPQERIVGGIQLGSPEPFTYEGSPPATPRSCVPSPDQDEGLVFSFPEASRPPPEYGFPPASPAQTTVTLEELTQPIHEEVAKSPSLASAPSIRSPSPDPAWRYRCPAENFPPSILGIPPRGRSETRSICTEYSLPRSTQSEAEAVPASERANSPAPSIPRSESGEDIFQYHNPEVRSLDSRMESPLREQKPEPSIPRSGFREGITRNFSPEMRSLDSRVESPRPPEAHEETRWFMPQLHHARAPSSTKSNRSARSTEQERRWIRIPPYIHVGSPAGSKARLDRSPSRTPPISFHRSRYSSRPPSRVRSISRPCSTLSPILRPQSAQSPSVHIPMQNPILLQALMQQLTDITNDPRLSRAGETEMNTVTKKLLPELAQLTQAISQLAAKVDLIAGNAEQGVMRD